MADFGCGIHLCLTSSTGCERARKILSTSRGFDGGKGRVAEATVLRVAKSVGLDLELLEADVQLPDVEKHLVTSMRPARVLRFMGRRLLSSMKKTAQTNGFLGGSCGQILNDDFRNSFPVTGLLRPHSLLL